MINYGYVLAITFPQSGSKLPPIRVSDIARLESKCCCIKYIEGNKEWATEKEKKKPTSRRAPTKSVVTGSSFRPFTSAT